VLPRIQHMRLKLIREAFDDADFIFELKHDGFRGVVYIEDQQCRLVSRKSTRPEVRDGAWTMHSEEDSDGELFLTRR